MRLIVDTAYDALITIDATSLILDWNRQAEATFGWSESEAVGRSLAETIIPERFRPGHEQGIARFLATGVDAHEGVACRLQDPTDALLTDPQGFGRTVPLGDPTELVSHVVQELEQVGVGNRGVG